MYGGCSVLCFYSGYWRSKYEYTAAANHQLIINAKDALLPEAKEINKYLKTGSVLRCRCTETGGQLEHQA